MHSLIVLYILEFILSYALLPSRLLQLEKYLHGIININVYMGMKIDYTLSKGQKLPQGSTKFGRIWNMNHKDISNNIHGWYSCGHGHYC